MAPPEEITVEAAAASAAESAAGDRPISTVLIVIAMQTEAVPLVAKFNLAEDTEGSQFPRGVPWVRYHGTYKGLNINIVWPGKDSIHGVDSVGTISASLVTYASIQSLKPDLIINAGTAGGFRWCVMLPERLSGRRFPVLLQWCVMLPERLSGRRFPVLFPRFRINLCC